VASDAGPVRCCSLVAVTEKARKPMEREAELLATAEKAVGRATRRHRAIEAIATQVWVVAGKRVAAI
jgi:hypothetical protein